MKERIHWIDMAKGIAIILVVVGHVVSSYHEAGLYLDNHLFNFTHQFAYSFHMALFMMLSGYLVGKGNTKETKWKQILKKLINYGIPYVIFSAIWVGMKLVMSGHVNSEVTIKDFLLIPVYPISFMWFIYALMIMQILQVFISPKKAIGKVIHLLVALSVYFLQPYLAKSLTDIRFSDCIVSDFMKNYIFFLLGIYITQYVIDKFDNKKMIAGAISGIFLVAGNIVRYLIPANGLVGNRAFKILDRYRSKIMNTS